MHETNREIQQYTILILHEFNLKINNVRYRFISWLELKQM